jgi:hypothetical protein
VFYLTESDGFTHFTHLLSQASTHSPSIPTQFFRLFLHLVRLLKSFNSTLYSTNSDSRHKCYCYTNDISPILKDFYNFYSFSINLYPILSILSALCSAIRGLYIEILFARFRPVVQNSYLVISINGYHIIEQRISLWSLHISSRFLWHSILLLNIFIPTFYSLYSDQFLKRYRVQAR